MVFMASQEEFKFKETVKIYDIDAQGIAHYSSYYRFFIDAIEKFMRDKVGVKYPIVSDELWFVIVESHITYKRPLKLGDEITISISPQLLSKRIIRFDTSIIRDSEKVTEGYIILAAVNPKIWKTVDLPDELANKITSA